MQRHTNATTTASTSAPGGEPALTTDAWLNPSLATRIAQNFFTHSGHIPLTLLILELLLSSGGYLFKPDAYILVGSGLVQAAALSLLAQRGTPRPFLGNLIGPFVYSLWEGGTEGFAFIGQWHHQAYWAFALCFGALHWLETRYPRRADAMVLIENILRSAIPLVMYALFEARDSNAPAAFDRFFDDRAHVFLSIVLLLIGALLGFADLTLRRSQATIRLLANRLRRYSEWSLGRDVLERAIVDEETLGLQRTVRTVAFMDVRGFTRWSEVQSPEQVLAMLNDYYAMAEKQLLDVRPVKIKFTADEVMAVFSAPAPAIAVAQRWLTAATAMLAPFGLNAGAGVHTGPVVEGILGGQEARAYDVIGDTVNTANRLCAVAAAGELLVSASTMDNSGYAAGVRAWRDVSLKGKREPVRLAVLETA